MGRRLLSFAISLGLALSAPALGAVAGRAPVACAATDQRAALVVDTGAQSFSFCVALGADSVSGLDVIRLAHEQFDLDYRLGYGGRAVCRLAGVGVDGDDCFSAYPDFWGYWRGDGTGGWGWSGTGAADTTVEPGDVEGWSWGAGQDGGTHPKPPDTREEDVCPPVSPSPTPSPTPSPSGGGHGHEAGSGGRNDGGSGAGNGVDPSATPSPTPSATSEDRRQRDRADASATATASPSATSSADAVYRAAGPGGTGSDGGAAGSLLALAAILVLGVAGAWLVRRRGVDA